MMEQIQKLPLPVLYVGLGAFFLAPIIAGIMQRSTTVTFMLFLRLAIGWHFLFEGLHKIHSEHLGAIDGNRPFNSAAYFENSEGPLAPHLRKFIGDPDEKLLAKLKVEDDKPMSPDFLTKWSEYYTSKRAAGKISDSDKAKEAELKKAANDKAQELFDKLPEPNEAALPAGLIKDWTDYVAKFKAAYSTTDEENKAIDAKLKEAKANLYIWLNGTRDTKKASPGGGGTADVEEPTKNTITNYHKKLDALKDTFKLELETIGTDGRKGPAITALRGDIIKLRGELNKDLDEKTQELKDDLVKVLGKRADTQVTANLDKPRKDNLYWVNFATRWGVFSIGLGLLAGFFTRIACLGGIVFLLSTYLVDSPFPWLPSSPKSEGNYLFVNKNIIEMLALMVIASTPSGKWMGLDAFISKFKNWIQVLILLMGAGAFFWFVLWKQL